MPVRDDGLSGPTVESAEPAPPGELYTLPPEVGMTLMTDRIEFLNLFEARIRSEGAAALGEEQWLELIRAVRDIVTDRIAAKERREEALRRLANLVQQARGFERMAETVAEGFAESSGWY